MRLNTIANVTNLRIYICTSFNNNVNEGVRRTHVIIRTYIHECLTVYIFVIETQSILDFFSSSILLKLYVHTPLHTDRYTFIPTDNMFESSISVLHQLLVHIVVKSYLPA